VQIPINVEDIDLHIFLDKVEYKKFHDIFPLKLPFANIEFTKHIKMYDHYVDIFVEKSKTDCYRKGNHEIISRLDSLQCPVKILLVSFASVVL
jgi:hypothetical protein